MKLQRPKNLTLVTDALDDVEVRSSAAVYSVLEGMGYENTPLYHDEIYLPIEYVQNNLKPIENYLNIRAHKGVLLCRHNIFSLGDQSLMFELGEDKEDETLLGYRVITLFFKDSLSLEEINKTLIGVNEHVAYEGFSKKEYRVHIVTQSNNGYNLVSVAIHPKKIDIDKHYNDDFRDVNFLIESTLKENTNGLILLHGKPGTGKTNYIKSLTTIKDKTFIYTPSDMIGFLTSPSFIQTIIHCKNPVIILEDCEEFLVDRSISHVSSNYVTTLLNMTDGILSDIMEIQIICTFNNDIAKIDPALRRKGRLVCEYYFSELSEEKSNNILREIGGQLEPGEERTLANLYSKKGSQITVKKEEKKKIGFG